MKEKTFVFKAKDHLVSKEEFSIYWDGLTEIAHTDFSSSKPIDAYYNSKEYASHKADANSLLDQLYNTVQYLMLFLKWKIIRPYHQSGSLLDIGAGTGTFAKFLKRKGFDVEIVEPNSTAIQPYENLLTHYKSIGNVPKTNTFTLITLWHVLEHLPELDSVFTSFAAHLKPLGTLIIAVPNWNSNDAQHYGANWAALDVPRHLWHFTPNGLKKLARYHGFECVAQHPLWFDAFYISYLSERAKGNKPALLLGVCKGFYFTLKAVFNKRYSSLIFVFKKINSN